MKKFLLSFVLVVCVLSCSFAFGQELSSHDIILRVANESFVPNTVPYPFQFHIPQGWKLQALGNEKLAFQVPYHVGVGGFMMIPVESLTLERLIADVNERTQITFTELSNGEFSGTGFNGTQAVYSGRFGGEVWHFIAILATHSSGKQIVYWAQAPETWFAVYEPLFRDMVKSLH
jgi:hypothetical protein